MVPLVSADSTYSIQVAPMPPSQHPSRICLPDSTWLIDTGQNRERAKKVWILENERFNKNENETEAKAENEHVVGAENETQDENETETKVENDGGTEDNENDYESKEVTDKGGAREHKQLEHDNDNDEWKRDEGKEQDKENEQNIEQNTEQSGAAWREWFIERLQRDIEQRYRRAMAGAERASKMQTGYAETAEADLNVAGSESYCDEGALRELNRCNGQKEQGGQSKLVEHWQNEQSEQTRVTRHGNKQAELNVTFLQSVIRRRSERKTERAVGTAPGMHVHTKDMKCSSDNMFAALATTIFAGESSSGAGSYSNSIDQTEQHERDRHTEQDGQHEQNRWIGRADQQGTVVEHNELIIVGSDIDGSGVGSNVDDQERANTVNEQRANTVNEQRANTVQEQRADTVNEQRTNAVNEQTFDGQDQVSIQMMMISRFRVVEQYFPFDPGIGFSSVIRCSGDGSDKSCQKLSLGGCCRLLESLNSWSCRLMS